MKHEGTKRLETERLILRPFALEDAEDMFNGWASDPRATRYLTWPPHASINDSLDIINLWLGLYPDPHHYVWALELKETSRVVGSLGVVYHDDDIESMELGYCLTPHYWGLGLMTEALGAAVDFLFGRVGARRLQARHDLRNPGSGRVLQKRGFVYEGTRRQGDLNNTGIYDAAFYGLLNPAADTQ